jgi:putative spermidine/putrescine transport system permease protein
VAVNSVAGHRDRGSGLTGPIVKAFRRHWLLIPVVVVVAIAFLWPVAKVLILSFGDPGTHENYSQLTSSVIAHVIERTLYVSALVTVVALVLALPYAHIAAREVSPRIGRFMLFAVVASLFVSIVVRGYAWLAILARGGLLGLITEHLGWGEKSLVPSLAGIVIGMAQFGVPLMVMPIYSSMVRYDARLDLAAASLGAPPARTFWSIYLPHIASGVGAGCATVFTVTLGYYVLPAILGGPQNSMIGTIIASKAQRTLDTGGAAALSVLLLVISLLSFVVIFRATRRDIHG